MGLFDKLLGKDPDRSRWGAIANNIAIDLEQFRQTWFKMCVEVLRNASSDESEVTIKRSTLGGNGLRAVKAYQLFLVSSYMAQHEYVPHSQGRDFADLLFAQVCGTELESTLHYFARYEQADGGSGTFRFSSDIAKYITANETPLREAMTVSTTMPILAHFCHMILADSFGDQRTVHSLQRKIEERDI